MGWGLIWAGLCLLFTPCVNVVDLLPDLIGFGLIQRGLWRLRFLDDHLSHAHTAARQCVVLGAGKLLGVVAVGFFRDATTTLLITFVITVLELLFLLPLVRSLCDGVESVGIRYECPVAYQRSEQVKLWLQVLVWVRCLGALAPEFFCLWDPVLTGEFGPNYIQLSNDLKQMERLTSLAQLIVTVAVGIFAALKAKALFVPLRRDGALERVLEQEWMDKVGADPVRMRHFQLDSCLAWLVAGSVFAVQLYLSYINYLPPVLLFVCLWVALGRARLTDGKGRRRRVAIWGLVSVISTGYRTWMAGVLYPYLSQGWQGLWPVYPLGFLEGLCLGVGLFEAIGLLDGCSLEIYGRRRIRTGFFKVLAVLVALCAGLDYAFVSYYDFLRLVIPAFPLYLKHFTQTLNITVGVVGNLCAVCLVLRFWVLGGTLREQLKR